MFLELPSYIILVTQAVKCRIVIVLSWALSEQPNCEDASAGQLVASPKKWFLALRHRKFSQHLGNIRRLVS